MTNWDGRGSCTGETTMYPAYAQGADILSFDIYPVNSNLPLTAVATGVDNLRSWGGGKPVYAFIETTAIQGGAGPTPTEIKAETWLAIIHGARGTEYFCHVFKPTFVEDGCLAPTIAAALKAQNGQLLALAPVLNSPSVGGTRVSAGQRVDEMTKRYGADTYVFAVNTSPTSTTATFTLPGTHGATAVAIGEKRRIPFRSGTFSDRFGGYATHLYRIAATSGASATLRLGRRPAWLAAASRGRGDPASRVHGRRGRADRPYPRLGDRRRGDGHSFEVFAADPDKTPSISRGICCIMCADVGQGLAAGVPVRNCLSVCSSCSSQVPGPAPRIPGCRSFAITATVPGSGASATSRPGQPRGARPRS